MLIRQIAVSSTVVALVTAGIVTGPANSAPGGANLRVDPTFAKTLDKGKVKTKALAPATFSAMTFMFPTSADAGGITLAGGIRWSAKKSVVTVKKMVLNESNGRINAQLSIKDPTQPAPMGFSVEGLMRLTGGDNRMAQEGTWTAGVFSLAKSVTITGNKMNPAALIGSPLGIKLKKGAVIGTMDVTVTK